VASPLLPALLVLPACRPTAARTRAPSAPLPRSRSPGPSGRTRA